MSGPCLDKVRQRQLSRQKQKQNKTKSHSGFCLNLVWTLSGPCVDCRDPVWAVYRPWLWMVSWTLWHKVANISLSPTSLEWLNLSRASSALSIQPLFCLENRIEWTNAIKINWKNQIEYNPYIFDLKIQNAVSLWPYWPRKSHHFWFFSSEMQLFTLK